MMKLVSPYSQHKELCKINLSKTIVIVEHFINVIQPVDETPSLLLSFNVIAHITTKQQLWK